MPAELVRNRKPRPRIYWAILAAGDALWRRPSAARTVSLAAHGLRAPLAAWSCAPARPHARASAPARRDGRRLVESRRRAAPDCGRAPPPVLPSGRGPIVPLVLHRDCMVSVLAIRA